jgi:HD-like signal output (HDOD) protein
MTLEALLQNPNALPTAPKVLAELISSFNNTTVAVNEISHKISADPVLSAKLLRLANSAYYHVPRTVGTVDDAVRMLGFVTVRTLVISAGLVGGFRTVPGLDLKRFWRYSLHAAVAARWIARKAGENTDLAFTIGLMHSIGQLVIHTGIPPEAEAIDKIAGPFDAGRMEQEQVALGYNYADVGAELAARWKFPQVFADAIRAFPDPPDQIPFNRMAAVIHLAAWRARLAENQPGDEEQIAASFPAAVAGGLGLAPEMLEQMPPLAELSAGLDALIQ